MDDISRHEKKKKMAHTKAQVNQTTRRKETTQKDML
jgi:hypothetical protein